MPSLDGRGCAVDQVSVIDALCCVHPSIFVITSTTQFPCASGVHATGSFTAPPALGYIQPTRRYPARAEAPTAQSEPYSTVNRPLVCLGCSEPIWTGSNGVLSAFCGKQHANQYDLGFKDQGDIESTLAHKYGVIAPDVIYEVRTCDSDCASSSCQKHSSCRWRGSCGPNSLHQWLSNYYSRISTVDSTFSSPYACNF